MRDSSCATSSKAAPPVASRNASYQEGGVAPRRGMSRSSRSSSGSSRTDLPTARGGPAGFSVCPSPSIVRQGPPRRSDRRGGPWRTIEGEGQTEKPAGPPRAVGKSVRELPLLERLDLDIPRRGATPPSWYEAFREATGGAALELVAQELSRIKRERGGDALACFSSAQCSHEENYVMMRMFRAALGTNNIDHCTRLCHSTSVAAMQRALNTSAAS